MSDATIIRITERQLKKLHKYYRITNLFVLWHEKLISDYAFIDGFLDAIGYEDHCRASDHIYHHDDPLIQRAIQEKLNKV